MTKDHSQWKWIALKQGKGEHEGKNKDKGKSWWNYGSFGSGAFGRGRGKRRGHGNKGKGKGKAKGKSKPKGKDFGKKGKTRAMWTPSSAEFVLSMGIGHVNVLTGWFNKLFQVILLNFHKYQFNLLLAKEFNLKFDNLPNPVIPLLHQLQLRAEPSQSLWERLG